MERLDPCPCCDGKAIVDSHITSTQGAVVNYYFRIRCKKCGCTKDGVTGNISYTLDQDGLPKVLADDLPKAIKVWNKKK